MAKFNPGDRVVIADGSDLQGRIAVVSDDSVRVFKQSKGIVYVKLGRFHVPFSDHDLRPAFQTCNDCDGKGRIIPADRDVWCLDCGTCLGSGRIDRTGPYKLKDGTWSDGLDRRLELARRDTTQNRWEVWQDAWGDWVAYRFDGETTNYECDEYPTHAEAVAYADRMARSNA